MTTIKSSGIRCKGSVKDNFEAVPSSIYNYIELGLISGNDLVVYLRLYQLDNNIYGYSYPTIEDLMIMTNLSKKTIIESLRNLESVGLIKKDKSKIFPNKNIYFVYKPLDQSELYTQVPEKVKELKEKKIKLGLLAEQDKERLHEYKQNEQQKIQVEEIISKIEATNNEINEEMIYEMIYDMKFEDERDREMLIRLMKLKIRDLKKKKSTSL
jgi:predicted transcriptional regulator